MNENNGMNNGTAVPMQQPVDNVNIGQNVGTPINDNRVQSITDITSLQAYAKGVIVRLPDFAEGQPFVVRMKRPSLLVLAKSGQIPNSLLNAAGTLFAEGGSGLDADNPKMLSDMYDVCKVICDAALVQPTMAEIEQAGLALTDEQIMAIFNYTQVGVKALENFREEQGNTEYSSII